MQVDELFGLTTWVKSNIVEKEIVNKYQQLHGVLSRNSQANQPKQPFHEQKTQLFEAIKALPLSELSLEQIEILNKVKIGGNISQEAVKRIEELFTNNVMDSAYVAQILNNSIREIGDGINWINETHNVLERIVSVEPIIQDDTRVVVRVRFSGDAKIENLTQLRKWSNAWWDIGRGITMAQNDAPDSISVIGASKGSIIVALLVTWAVADTLNRIILSTLKSVEQYHKMIAAAENAKILGLFREQLVSSMKEDAASYKSTCIKKICDDICAHLGISGNTATGDKVNAVEKSVKKLFDFIIKDGKIDFVLPPKSGDTESDNATDVDSVRARLRERIQEVRRLEGEMKKIEWLIDDSDEEKSDE